MAEAAKVWGPIQGGLAQRQAAKFEAKQLERQAGEITGAGQRSAQQQRKAGETLVSDVKSAQVAGGGTTTDPQAIRQQAKAKDRAEFAALSTLFQSEALASAKRLQAKSTRLSGQIAATQGILGGVSNLPTGSPGGVPAPGGV